MKRRGFPGILGVVEAAALSPYAAFFMDRVADHVGGALLSFGPLDIVPSPSVAVPNMPLSGTVRKINDERMCLYLIRGMAGCDKCFAMSDEAAIRDREICWLRAWRRWLGKEPNG